MRRGSLVPPRRKYAEKRMHSRGVSVAMRRSSCQDGRRALRPICWSGSAELLGRHLGPPTTLKTLLDLHDIGCALGVNFTLGALHNSADVAALLEKHKQKHVSFLVAFGAGHSQPPFPPSVPLLIPLPACNFAAAPLASHPLPSPPPSPPTRRRLRQDRLRQLAAAGGRRGERRGLGNTSARDGNWQGDRQQRSRAAANSRPRDGQGMARGCRKHGQGRAYGWQGFDREQAR